MVAVDANIKGLHAYADRCASGARRWVHYGQKVRASLARAYLHASAHTSTACPQFADAHVSYGNDLLASVPAGDRALAMPPGFGPALSKVSATLKDVQEVSRESLAVTEQTMCRLAQSNEEELRRVKETKRRFAESDEFWAAAVRRAHSVRKESSEEEAVAADRDFVDAKLAFECSRFEHVAALNEVEGSKQLELIESARASVTALAHAYEQSCGRMRELAAHLDSLLPAINDAREEQSAERARNDATVQHLKQLREEHRSGVRRHSPVRQLTQQGLLQKEGYLYKKSSKAIAAKIHTGTSSWKRLWFRLDSGVLYYQKKSKGDRDDGVRAINLLICTVNMHDKETGKRFCFDLVSPYRSYTLQAESASSLQSWVEALRASIEHNFYALGRSDGSLPAFVGSYASDGSAGSDAEASAPWANGSSVAPLVALAQGAGNDVCADCGASGSSPDWVVMPYGVLVCIECSGIHRSLGVHISKVRSLSLDTWSVEMAACVGSLGNATANSVLLAELRGEASATTPTGASSRADKEAWIRDKYQLRTHIARDTPAVQLPAALCAAARQDDNVLPLLRLVLQSDRDAGALDALCDGGEGEGEEGEGEGGGVSAAHAAAAADRPRSLELLLQAGATLDLPSRKLGRTPCHVAAAHGSERCLALLLHRGAEAGARDADGRTPVELARRSGHESCVLALEQSAERASGGADNSRNSKADLWLDSKESSMRLSGRNSGTWWDGPGGSSLPTGSGSMEIGPGGGNSSWPSRSRHQRTPSGGLGGLSSSEVIASLDDLGTSSALDVPMSPDQAKPSTSDGEGTAGGMTNSLRRQNTIGRRVPRPSKLLGLVRGASSRKQPTSNPASPPYPSCPPGPATPGPRASPATPPHGGGHRRSRTWGGTPNKEQR